MASKSLIFEDAPGTGGYSPITSDQLKSALAGSGLDQGSQTSIYSTLIPSSSGGGNSGGGNNGGGGSQPGYNYTDLINQDALFGQQRADLSAESASDAANRAAAIQRALVQWGIVPDFASEAGKLGLSADTLGFLKSDIGPGTKDLADKNTAEGLSIYARLQKQHKDQIRAIKNALASRGMAASGEAGSQLGDEAQNYKQQLTDSEQQLLQYITGAIAAFTGAERERNRTLSQYMMDAAGRQAGLLGDAGFGGGGSGGGGGGGASSDFQYGAKLPSGHSLDDIYRAASEQAPSYGGVKYVPMHIMDQGMVFPDGTVHIKFTDPTGRNPNSTESVKLGAPGGSSGSSTPAPSGGLFGSDFGG